jgi:hypothetical protein
MLSQIVFLSYSTTDRDMQILGEKALLTSNFRIEKHDQRQISSKASVGFKSHSVRAKDKRKDRACCQVPLNKQSFRVSFSSEKNVRPFIHD